METYLSPDQVCDLIPGMTPTGLAQMRFRGDGPAFIKPSPRKVVYTRSEIERYLGSKTQTSTSSSLSA